MRCSCHLNVSTIWVKQIKGLVNDHQPTRQALNNYFLQVWDFLTLQINNIIQYSKMDAKKISLPDPWNFTKILRCTSVERPFTSLYGAQKAEFSILAKTFSLWTSRPSGGWGGGVIGLGVLNKVDTGRLSTKVQTLALFIYNFQGYRMVFASICEHASSVFIFASTSSWQIFLASSEHFN